MSASPENNYVSIIVCHYSLADDFGEVRARKQAETRSEMLHITMDSLEKNTDYPAEIIMIDNGGDPDDSDYLLDLSRKGVVNTYVRNKNNMYFGWAWNQGMKLATGNLVCLSCNDIQFLPNWLSTTIEPLLKYPWDRLIATPLITPDKDRPKYMRGEIDGYRLNSFAGSNCMILTKDTFYNIGEMTTENVAGTMWHRKMNAMGYTMVAPQENMADHLAHKGGVNFFEDIKVVKILLNKEVIDYSYE